MVSEYYVCMYVSGEIKRWRDRAKEREKDRETHTHTHTDLELYLYIYISFFEKSSNQGPLSTKYKTIGFKIMKTAALS